jgi:exodeoxyribonuclease VII large subunit
MERQPLLPLDRPATAPRVMTVSQLTDLIEGTLESQFQAIWVSGEVSDVRRPHSGHVYFTLKDEQAQIAAVVWKSTAVRLKFKLEEGQQVICHGDLDVYPPRGSYQLAVQQIQPQGLGALQLAFQQLHRRLEADGLFDPRHKKPLPSFPRRVGFVTSPTGAAIRDFLEIAARRFAGVEILVIPARVQGECAADEIVRGIELANRLRPPLDVLVVGRGGGSLEDLWCFNEEAVVRAIFASRLPVVSAVGHEIDTTLSDLVADVRALTPSEAAERIIPSADELLARLSQFQRRMATTLRGRVTSFKGRVEQLGRSRVLRNPKSLIYDLAHRLDELDQQAARAIRRSLARASDRLKATAGRLESLSPLGVLARGYSATVRADDGSLVRASDEVEAGESIRTRLARGELVSRVESRSPSAPVPKVDQRIE